MNHRQLGASNLLVSEFCLGTMMFGGKTAPDESVRIIRRAVDAGVNFVDTADVYNAGRSEEIVGRALRGIRDRVVLATKVGIEMGPNPNDGGLSRKHIMYSVEQSLRRLGTDYIDIYYVHRPDYCTPIETTLRALDDLVRQGKVRHLACSNFRAFQLSKALWTSDVRNLARFEAIQPPYNLLTRDIEYELLPLCVDEGLGVCVYNPLAGGLLTGKHDPSKPPAAGTRFANDTMGKMYYDRYWTESNFAAVARVKAIAEGCGRDMAQFALAWVLSNPAITSIIIGATSLRHVEHNIAATEFALAESERAACEEVWQLLRPLRFFYGR
mgnify:CR=1 FL=1